jgi:hypothetical protein
MNYIQLFINEPSTAELDMTQEIEIALQYSIADIKDISKRNAAYSKTIVLPGTKKNNYWFGNLFDVNADFTMFNPNKRTAAKLLVNTEVVMDGFLQLRKITKLNNVDNQGNQIGYEVVIYNNSVDLMSVIGEKTINLLDMREFGHTFSNTNVKNSWTHTWEDGYVYPMFGTHTKDSQYSVDYFYPAIYYRAILDQMIREAGFGWTGSLANNDQFNHECISYVTDGRPKVDEADRREREFRVGRTQSYTNTAYPNWNANQDFAYVSSFATAQFNADTPSTGYDYFDNDNNWNTTTYQWDVNYNGAYSGELLLKTRLKLQNNTGSSTTITRFSSADPNLWPQWKMEVKVEIWGGTAWSTWNSGETSVYSYTGTSITLAPGGSQQFDLPVQFTLPQVNLAVGNKVRVRYRPIKIAASWFFTQPITVTVEVRNKFGSTDQPTFFRNTAIVGQITQNEYVDLAKYLPDKIKQKDLLTDLIRRYNLYIQINPENPKQLIFDTRPDFYERGEIVDWTSKKDYSSPDEIELLSDLQSKLMIWSYKADNDEYNKNYSDVTGDVYGQYKYYFDNDFVKGEERIESSFSPTPLVKTPFNAIVPGIDPTNPKVQPRIFYYGGLRDCDGWNWTYQPTTGGSASESFSKYPYAGHFDDPIEPEIDINFGTNKYYYYDDWDFITDNNMFNTYWSDYVRQIETGRLITSYFYLDEYDIRYIKDNFYTKIFILDSYYYVNKIIDYKPLQNGVTKVELLKIVDGVRWERQRTQTVISNPTRPTGPFNVLFDLAVGFGNSSAGGGVVVGNGNVSGGKITRFLADGSTQSFLAKNMIVGSDNIMTGDNSMIVGDRNSITSGSSMVLGGSDNIVEGDAGGIILIGSNGITATQSGKVYIGDAYVVDTTTGTVTVGTSSTPWSPPSYYIEDTTIPAAKIQIINDNNVTLTSLVRGASGSEYIKHDVLDGLTGNGSSVFIQSSSLALESGDGSSNSSRLLSMPTYMSSIVYDNATLTAVSTVVLENVSSDGQLTLDSVANVANTRQDTINLFPGGGSYIKSYETVIGDESRIDFYPNGIDTTISANGVLSTSYMSDTSIQLTITDGTTFNNNISLNNLLTPGIQLTSDNAGAGNSAAFALSEDEIMLKLINGVFTTSIIQSTASVTINTGITASKFDNNTTAGETGFMLWDISANTLKRVSIGAANSGGTGFKVLRIPN